MSRALTHRLRRLEQHARALDCPSWQEFDMAAQRLQTAALAHIDALLDGQDPPARDELQAEADAALIERWCTARGTRMDWEGAAREFKARIEKLAARHQEDATTAVCPSTSTTAV